MSYPFRDGEPLPDHLADTGPMKSIRDAGRLPAWRRAVGLFSLLGAAALTVATLVLVFGPPVQPTPVALPTEVPATATVPPPTLTPVPSQNADSQTIQTVVVLPTLDPNQVPSLLATPMSAPDGGFVRAIRNVYQPYTIIPERKRSGVEQYTVVNGDTIFTIAERYGLKPETIVWGNDHSLVDGLRPGKVINILPVDGVYYIVQKDETIADIAKRFLVDPYTIIDADYNDLFGKKPEDTLPSSTRVVIPGGTREQITWTPVVQRVAGSGGAGGEKISFAPGEAGSCGLVGNPGGSGGWSPPLTTAYTWMRGFSAVHSGVDLSTPLGTPVHAAQGGTVIFAGWTNWGYGNTVVLAHGAFTTLYGHLSSVAVGCGQGVGAGQVIAYSGSSGNSTGPHLHFEIRYLDVPQDPTYQMAF